MKNRIFTLLIAAALVLMGAVAVMAQDQPAAAAPDQAAPAKAGKMAKHAKSAAMAEAVKPETVSGTLTTVDASKMMVVVTAGGVPYDFVVSKGTKITVGGSKAKLDDLGSNTNKQASVTFMAERKKGNLARSIEVTQ